VYARARHLRSRSGWPERPAREPRAARPRRGTGRAQRRPRRPAPPGTPDAVNSPVPAAATGSSGRSTTHGVRSCA
jgi:hypothetical protein